MAKPNRLLAVLAYLLPLIGPLVVIATQRRARFPLYHASQSLALLVGAVVVPGLWAALGWLVAWLPLLGPVLTASSFSLVIAAAILVAAGWLLGIVNSLRGRMNSVLLFGGWGERIFARLTSAPAVSSLVESVQPASRP